MDKQTELAAVRDEVYSQSELEMQKGGWGRGVTKASKELGIIAFSDIMDYLTISDQGHVTMIPLNALKLKKASRAIKSIKQRSRTISAEGESQVVETTLELTLHDKLGALKEGTDILGVKVQKHDVALSGGVTLHVVYDQTVKGEGKD